MTNNHPAEPFEAEVRAAFRSHLDGLEPLIPTAAPPRANVDISRVARISQSRGPRERTMAMKWAVFAMAIVAVAVVAVMAPAMVRTAPGTPPSVSHSATLVSPPATPALGVTGPWTRLVPWPSPTGPAPTASLAAWHDGFAVIDESGPNPAAWFWRDGSAWVRVSSADAVFAGADVVWLVSAPGGFVALGMPRPSPEGSGPAPTRHADAQRVCGGGVWWSGGACSVWFSPDGLSWRQLDTGSLFSNSGVVDVAAGPRGVVAIGYGTEYMPGPAHVWYSADGSSWKTVELPVPVRSAGPESVAAGPNGFEIVGMLQITDIGNNIRPGAWWSRDGLTWAESTVAYDQRRDSSNWLSKVLIGRDGMVALVELGPLGAGPSEWQSVDGRTWQWLTPTQVTPLISDGQRMVGERATGADMYQSYDGTHWTPLQVTGGDAPGPSCRILAISPTGIPVAGDSCPIRVFAGLP
jgi:hypothetical protein